MFFYLDEQGFVNDAYSNDGGFSWTAGSFAGKSLMMGSSSSFTVIGGVHKEIYFTDGSAVIQGLRHPNGTAWDRILGL